MTLPDQNSQPPWAKKHPRKRSLPALEGRVLLAEDNPDNRALLAYYLEHAGAKITVIDNGQAMVEVALAAEPPFDLIVMDMQMPGLDGYEAARRVRVADCSVPILALIARAMRGDREKCQQAGCTNYMSKPVDQVQLLEKVRRYVDSHKTGQTRLRTRGIAKTKRIW